MSATIGDFYQRVSRAIRRRNVYDDDIPAYAADAVRELENNHNWKYMWEELRGTLVVSATVNTLDLLPLGTTTGVKSIRYMKLIGSAGDIVPVRKTRKEYVLSITSGRPGAFWMLTKDSIGLDAFPNEAYNYEIGNFRYSARPLIDTLAWLTIGEDLLVARTIRKMQPLLRDDKLVKRWQEVENSTFPALLEAEIVSEFDGEDNICVPFSQEVEEDLGEMAEFS